MPIKENIKAYVSLIALAIIGFSSCHAIFQSKAWKEGFEFDPCQSYLDKAESYNNKSIDNPDDMWDITAVYYLNRYEICKRYGEK